jgi:predicted metal-dependent hydrolase
MNKDITYLLIRSRKRKRTISMRILSDGRIIIRAPHRTPKEEIDSFFHAKNSWVKRKLAEREKSSQGSIEQPTAFVPGEKFLYLGDWYPLEIQDTNSAKNQLSLYRGIFLLSKKSADQAKDLFVRWYKNQAKNLFEDRVNYYSKNFGFFPKSIKITSAKFRYGSCSPDNKLSFTWRLIMAPLVVIDYVIIHELMHIKEKNHSGKFWNLVEAEMPEYRSHRIWLKEQGHLLRI